VPHCGVYVELAERSAYDSPVRFADAVDSGRLRDQAAAPFVYAGERERPWSVEYSREGRSLGIEVDLMAWRLNRRWNGAGELDWPMLDSPVARETRDGSVQVRDAHLTCGPGAAWLWGCAERQRWVAGYHGLAAAPLELVVPGGSVRVPEMGTGLVVWDQGTVSVRALGLGTLPTVSGGVLSTGN
jgi:hypothetical protein